MYEVLFLAVVTLEPLLSQFGQFPIFCPIYIIGQSTNAGVILTYYWQILTIKNDLLSLMMESYRLNQIAVFGAPPLLWMRALGRHLQTFQERAQIFVELLRFSLKSFSIVWLKHLHVGIWLSPIQWEFDHTKKMHRFVTPFHPKLEWLLPLFYRSLLGCHNSIKSQRITHHAA